MTTYINAQHTLKLKLLCDNIVYHTPNNTSITNISEITFCNWFNSPIDLRQMNLRKVVFGDEFNQAIILPYTLESAHFESKFNQPIELTKGLVWSLFGFHYEQLLLLPKTMRDIYVCSKSIMSDNGNKLCFSKYLNKIALRCSAQLSIIVPKYVMGILTNIKNGLLVLNKNLLAVTFHCTYNQQWVLPKNVRIIMFQRISTKFIVFKCPKYLTHLYLGKNYTWGPLVLNDSLKYLELYNGVQMDHVPENIMCVNYHFNHGYKYLSEKVGNNLPNGINEKVVRTNYEHNPHTVVFCYSDRWEEKNYFVGLGMGTDMGLGTRTRTGADTHNTSYGKIICDNIANKFSNVCSGIKCMIFKCT